MTSREITAEELFADPADPFVRHQVDRRTVERAWARGAAVVVQGGRHRSRNTQPGPVLTCLGPRDDLGPLLRDVDQALDARPGRVTVERDACPAMPPGWSFRHVRTWDWLWTCTRPDGSPRHAVEDLSEPHHAAAVDAVLDAANADSFARPGAPGVETWLGVRLAGRLVGLGALERMADGTGHLRGVSVLADARGNGVGSAVSHALTAHALASGSGVATLGCYADNEPALAIYHRLGYRTAHRFYSGAVVRPSSRHSTSASAPSR